MERVFTVKRIGSGFFAVSLEEASRLPGGEVRGARTLIRDKALAMARELSSKSPRQGRGRRVA